jgi:hypothetical protein
MDFKGVIINLVIVGVIVLSIMSFFIITQVDNNSANLITNNSLINGTYNGLTSNLGNAQTQADTASQTFGNITPTEQFGVVDVTSVVSPTSLFKTMGLGVYNILIQLPMKILGVPPVVAAVIDAILILLLILGIWGIWKGVFQ